MIGTILGERYELKEKIGEGGMAEVYTAHCRILDRTVAVKILKEEFSKDNVFVQKFKTEALAAARLSHPNIVNIFDVGQCNDIHYIVMEYVEGQTLQALIKEQGALPVKQAVDIAIMICDGIRHAHEKGIIHRDIKPHNILITNQGIVKVADFGIAQAINNKTITFGGDVVGSVHYISPEQAKGEPVSPATDVYSLGCVLYEMLTGKPPFEAESMITVALKHIHDEPVLPRKYNQDIPVSLEKIVLKAMEKQPVYRFSDAGEMSTELRKMKGVLVSGEEDDGIGDLAFPSNREGDEKMRRRRIKPIGIVIIIAAVIGFLSGIVYVFNDSLFGKEVVVPDVINMDMKEAQVTLKSFNLEMTIKGHSYSDEVVKDAIISQKPMKGQKVKEGRSIEVIVSDGPEEQRVPNLVGATLSDAKIKIKNAGFEVGHIDEEYDDKYAENEVISQEPRFGSSAAKGSDIDVLISKGPAPSRISAPDLKGLTLEEAGNKLKANNLDQGKLGWQESQEYFKDQIMAQDPAAGVQIDEGSSIDLTVSKGPGPSAKIQAIQFDLPDNQEYYHVVLVLKDAKGERTVYDEYHQGGSAVNVAVNYFGSGTVIVKLNDNQWKTLSL